jgi:FSR family fosmidomycin resistance protein-like MFS transporter
VGANRRILLANSVYHLMNDAAVTVMAGQITVLRRDLVFGDIDTGFLTAIALLVTVAAQIAFGHMADRRDPSRFLPVGIAYLGIASMAIAGAATFPVFIALVALSRVGAGFYHPVGISWIGRAFAGRDLDRAMGFQSSFGDAGVILGMGSGAVLGSAFGWQIPFLVWGALNLLAVGLGLYLVRNQRSPPGEAAPRRVGYRAILRDVRYWLLPIAIGGATFNVISTFGPPLVQRKFLQSDAVAGVSIALWILAGTIAAFYFGRLSARFGRYRTLLAAYLSLTVASLAVATLPLGFALAALWTLGSTLFVTYPATFSFISEASHVRLQGAAFGVIFGFQLLGGAAAVTLAGVLAEAFGPNPSAPFLLVAALCGVGFLYLLAIRRKAATERAESAVAAPQL